MGKRELKKQYKDLDVNIIDIISKFDPSENNKLTPFLVKQFHKAVNGETKVRRLKKRWEYELTKPKNKYEEKLSILVSDLLGGKENIKSIATFSYHLLNNRIENNDISTYNDWSEIIAAVTDADIKEMEKKMAKQTDIIYNDDTWLFLKPLSFKAAQMYGANTKWCTTMKDEPDYFYRYSRNGIILYTINKKTGKKFGFYSSPDEFSVWDAKDRRIDSMETRIPAELLTIIRDTLDLKTNKYNVELFSPEELDNMDKIYPILKEVQQTPYDDGVLIREEVMEMPEPTLDEWEPRSADTAYDNAGINLTIPPPPEWGMENTF